MQYVSGQSYEEYVKQHIFAPLEMRNSFVSQAEALQREMATGYRWWFGIPAPITFPYNRAELPAGYIISSAEDMAHFLIAQMNGGRYRGISVLSPDGIALMHTEPRPNTYGMGWESIRIDGNTLINHDGGTANFQCSMFFDTDHRIGVFVAANVMSALDAFSSPHGSSVLDGSTIRAMAQTVLSLATHRPLPDQGRGIRRSYVIFDVVIIALTALLVIALWRIPRRYRHLVQQGIVSRSDFARRSILIAALHFSWTLLVLYLAFNVRGWRIFVMFQPDLATWLVSVAVVVLLKGLMEIAMIRRVFRRTQSE